MPKDMGTVNLDATSKLRYFLPDGKGSWQLRHGWEQVRSGVEQYLDYYRDEDWGSCLDIATEMVQNLGMLIDGTKKEAAKAR